MILVRTYLAPSSIDGLGLFAAEDIPKGTITWEFYSEIDIVLEEYCLTKVQFEFVDKNK